jgi:hypothetical protein
VTAPARITQADMDRLHCSAKKHYGERCRIVFDFAHARAEVIPGEPREDVALEGNPWDQDDAEA